LVARPQLARQERRDLAVFEALDRERDTVLLGRRCDGVTALCLLSILRREPYVYVLAGQVFSPTRDGEPNRFHTRRFRRDLQYLRGKPPDGRRSHAQSPA